MSVVCLLELEERKVDDLESARRWEMESGRARRHGLENAV